MKVYDTPSIRNVALVVHGGCGKTSLVSAMLFDMGAVNRLGRVDDGTTATDFDPAEIERRISLQTALAWGEWRKVKVNLVDAPGYANFFAEAQASLRVADAALLVVDGVAGVEVQTERSWRYAEELGIPRFIVMNRMDRERASFPRTLDALQAAFGRGVVPLAIPLGEFFFSSRRRHTRWTGDWSSDVCSSDLLPSNPDLRAEFVRRASG